MDLGARPLKVLDLCCGGGALSEAILERVPESMVYGLDGSQTMLEHARRRLARFGGRFRASLIELGDLSWRGRFEGFHAVVSSLAIHHLDDEGKRRLFKDLLAMLSPGGVVIIADLVAPASKRGTALAAEAWDHAVREQSRETGAGEAFAAFERLRWNMYRYPDEDDVDKPSRILDQLKWLEEAGFQRVDVYWMYAGHAIFGGEKPA
ncbi:MAG: methyltransferase domain-containing protein [Limnochordia bacterium]